MLNVLSVAYPLAPVCADTVGGAEQVLAGLDRALVQAGHRSIVVACSGSAVCGRLVSLPFPGEKLDDAEQSRMRRLAAEAITHVLQSESVDVVHMHGIDFSEYLPADGPPVLVTLHLPPDWYPARALRPDRLGVFFNAVSAKQHVACPDDVRLLPPISNGVALDQMQSGPGGDAAVMLARICPEKNIHAALAAAHEADCELLIGGAVYPYPAHEAYFEEEVRPLLDFRRRFLGPLGRKAVAALLGHARCLLVPSTASETSSLVAMESLACGTPVIAYGSGALPDIVRDGRTGFIVSSVHEIAQAIRRVLTLDRGECRREAEARFDFRTTAHAYLAHYQLLAALR